jgi:hypothetical protein
MKKYIIIEDNNDKSIVEYNCERAVVSTFEILWSATIFIDS